MTAKKRSGDAERDQHGAIAPDVHPELPEGARKALIPEAPQVALATLAENPSSDAHWIYEIKWDGIRTVARVQNGVVKLWSRAKRDVTTEFPELATLANSVDAREAVLDGETVVLDSNGRSDFQRLQSRMGVRNPSQRLMAEAPAVYYVFDVLYCDGRDLRLVPLIERKEFLRRILRTNQVIRLSDHHVGDGKRFFEAAAAQGLEGIVGKQADSAYPAGRTTAWLKFKIEKEVDGVVGGWTEPRGSREHFGALLLGLYDGEKLKFIGGIGSGFTVETQKRLWPRLQSLKIKECPFAERPVTREKATWIKPKLVARAKFSGWTEGTHLRQPRFAGLQEDRDPQECTLQKETKPPVQPAAVEPSKSPSKNKDLREISTETHAQSKHTPRAPAAQKDASAATEKETHKELASGSMDELLAEIDGRKLRFTNLNKIYFPADGIKKRDLLSYYLRMAPLILPFLKDRPLVLRRYPNGITGPSFFQKDADKNTPEWVKTFPIMSEGTGKPTHYFIANDRATLLYLTNLGCIDHNPWSSSIGTLENPDYIFFDLDPTPGAPFATVIKLAKILLGIMEKVKVAAFPKTSGATGFHIFIPVVPRYTFAQARAFVEAVASIVDAKYPGLLTAERSLSKRPKGRIYLDAHQNSSGQSLATLYTVRAFPRAPVSAPVQTSEMIPALKPEKWNLKSMERRLEKTGDLWSDFWKQRQEIEPAVERLERLG